MEAVLTLRAMTRKDIAEVHRIEVLSFRSPWSKLSLMGELKNNVAHYVVAELDGELIGYCGMWVLFDEAHITNIAIAPEHRGRSYGKKMLLGAMEIAEHLGAIAMTLEVRETNTVAKNMYFGLGFEKQGFRKGYYSDTGEGALLLWNRNIPVAVKNNACVHDAIRIQWETFER